MAKITNTTDELYFIGDVEVKPHSTAEVPDDVLTASKRSKAILGLFAAGKLAEGDDAEYREEKLADKVRFVGPPAFVRYAKPAAPKPSSRPAPKAEGDQGQQFIPGNAPPKQGE